MGLGGIPAAERVHIGFFGRRNAGKSSVINAVTGQELSIVSDVLGTTTDPVYKTMEILPMGPVVIIDTPGIDDEGELGELRVKKSHQVLNKCDIAVLVAEAFLGMTEADEKLLELIKKKNIPWIVCYNKSEFAGSKTPGKNEIYISAKQNKNINELKEMIASRISDGSGRKIISDKLSLKDVVILVIPIDSAAPKGRIILPQQQTLREILDCGAICICVQPEELGDTLSALKEPPKLVITDSQAFGEVSKTVPESIPLTSFSILFLRYKGELDVAYRNAGKISELKDGDKVLISEGCTHHRQCDDIGTVKLPRMIKAASGADVSFEFTSGGEFPEDLSEYSLVVHCGGCMLSEREVKYRMNHACDCGVPITNYGAALAYMNGILERAMEIFK
ncbi:MAG: [FeFe] hydrogenase H-cluster maturation GTPase HydF [Clostridia bacterium]|nr:[FeFe] hydrogenase H-cluster maturation GTPase HydF [Clostridia bacterium]